MTSSSTCASSITEKGADVFLSYRRSHWENARLIRAELEKTHRVFLDVLDLRAGDFAQALFHAVSTSDNFVVLLTKDNLTRWQDPDDWVRKEIAPALKAGINVVPILGEDFEFPAPEELPEEIAALPRRASPHGRGRLGTRGYGNMASLWQHGR